MRDRQRAVFVLAAAVGIIVLACAVWLSAGSRSRSSAGNEQHEAPPAASASPQGQAVPSTGVALGSPSATAVASASVARLSSASSVPAVGIKRAPGEAPSNAGSNAEASAQTRAASIELDKVRHMITDYHTLMGENPVGTNAEIMQALMGGNRNQATIGPPEGKTLNAKGELTDQWGTPYFFHQLSRDAMEIHSAGPDKIMGTSDDVVTR